MPYPYTYNTNWLTGGWKYRTKITIDYTKFSSTLTQFPLMLRISASCGASAQDLTAVFDELGANSLKLAVTKSDGTTEMYVEIEKWDSAGEEAILWISKSDWTISHTANTVIYLYYDVDHADNSTYVGVVGSTPGKAVWDANFVLVDHMADGADTSHTADSSNYGHNETKHAANEPNEVAAKIGKGQDFDGSNDDLIITHHTDFNFGTNGNFTFEQIINPDTLATLRILYKGPQWALNINGSKLWFRIREDGSNYAIAQGTNNLTAGVYTQTVCQRSGSTLNLFIAGVLDATATKTNVGTGVNCNPDSGTNIFYGSEGGGANWWAGIMDEIRISKSARSAAWLAATYYTCFDLVVIFSLPSSSDYPIAYDADLTLPTPKLEIAWANNPFDSSYTWTDVSTDLIAYSFSRGRQYDLDKFESGTLSLLMKNINGNYWKNNTSGAYYPNVDIRKPVRLTVTNGTSYARYVGFITRFTPRWELSGLQVAFMEIECSDAKSILSRIALNNAGYAQEGSGARIDNILDDAGFPAANRDVDAGVFQIMASGANANVNALDHSEAVAQAEIGLFYMGADGKAQFEGIDRRLSAAISTTSQMTFVANYIDVALSLDNSVLYNDVRVTRSGGTEQVSQDTANQTKYGKCSLVRSGVLLATDTSSTLISAYLLARYDNATLRADSIVIKLNSPRLRGQLIRALGYEISTKVTVVAPSPSGISGNYFIEKITENYDGRRPQDWELRFQLSDATFYTPVETTLSLRPDALNASTLTNTDPSYVNDQSDSTYTYLPSADAGPKDGTYALDDIPISSATIAKVRVYMRVASSANGRAATILITHGTTYVGSTNVMGGVAWYYTEYTTNPFSGAAWTVSEVNAAIAGCRLSQTAPTADVRCYEIYIQVTLTPQWG